MAQNTIQAHDVETVEAPLESVSAQSSLTTPLSAAPRTSGIAVQQIAVEHIAKSPFQVRDFEREQHLDDLARSIETLGILQPLLVRYVESSIPPYELVAGERRLRAAQYLGMKEVPAIIIELDNKETLQASIVENLQREDINAVEEALAYKRLADEFSLTQREIAESVGKKRATISNSLRLLQLDPFVLQRLLDGSLSAGHGKALLSLEEPKEQRLFARRAIAQSLSVHALERKISDFLSRGAEEDEDDPELEALERKLERQREKISEQLGVEGVGLRFDASGNRRLSVVFETEAAWKRFMRKIRE